VALLEATWATGSQAGNALWLRGELAIHLASGLEQDGRVLIDAFIAKMEMLLDVTRRAPFNLGSRSLRRYLQTQLRLLRQELERRDGQSPAPADGVTYRA
jgi:hypothetical protein